MLTRMYATLGIYGDQFDPVTLAESIGVRSYTYSLKGERRVLGVLKNSVLSLSSRDEIDGLSADEHIMSLIEQITPGYSQIRSALGRDGYIQCYLFFEGDVENVCTSFSPDTLRQLAAIDAGLSIDSWTSAADIGEAGTH